MLMSFPCGWRRPRVAKETPAQTTATPTATVKTNEIRRMTSSWGLNIRCSEVVDGAITKIPLECSTGVWVAHALLAAATRAAQLVANFRALGLSGIARSRMLAHRLRARAIAWRIHQVARTGNVKPFSD